MRFRSWCIRPLIYPPYAKPKLGVDNDLRSCPQVDSDGGGLTGCYSEDTQSRLEKITAGRKALLRRRMSGSGRQGEALLRPGWEQRLSCLTVRMCVGASGGSDSMLDRRLWVVLPTIRRPA